LVNLQHVFVVKSGHNLKKPRGDVRSAYVTGGERVWVAADQYASAVAMSSAIRGHEPPVPSKYQELWRRLFF